MIVVKALLFLLVSSGLYNVHFTYKSENADSVFLAGTFNNWNSHALKMKKRANGLFEIDVPLSTGRYEYKFVVNGTIWKQDPENPNTSPDGFGGNNSVVTVNARDYNNIIVKKGDGIINTGLYPAFTESDARFLNVRGDTLFVNVYVLTNDIDSLVWFINNMRRLGNYQGTSGNYNVYSTEYVLSDSVVNLKVILFDGKNSKILADKVLNISRLPHFTTPTYLKNMVFYQIFPERFYNGDTANDNAGTRPWKYEKLVPPSGWNVFYGGDINGIIKKLGYLDSLGINAIYLNPIFESPSNHKYNIVDYFHVDRHFGGDSIFLRFLTDAHKHGIKVILDGVFNHTSDRHPFFRDVVKKGPASRYYNYYIIKKWPFPRTFDNNNKPSDYYECWWGFGSLPKLNYNNENVRAYILKVAKYWNRAGIDGFRLDVPNEIPHDFWVQFRDSMKRYNKNFYIVGEIWGNGKDWLSGKQFDGTMNYPLRTFIIKLLQRDINLKEFVRESNGIYASIPQPARGALLNVLSTHDTKRIATILGSPSKVQLAYLLAFTMPGVPCVYYGDEIFVRGGKDPDCRRVFPWDSLSARKDMLKYFKNLISFREKYSIFNNGYVKYSAQNPSGIERISDGKRFDIYLNLSDTAITVSNCNKVLFRLQGREDNRIGPFGAVICKKN